jgi:hypothetical protein
VARKSGSIQADHPLIGTWVTSNQDSDAAFTFSVADGEFRVSGFCQPDGEKFEISGVTWNGTALAFTAIMPSTGWATKNVFSIRPDGKLNLELTTHEVWKKKRVKPGQLPRAWRAPARPR